MTKIQLSAIGAALCACAGPVESQDVPPPPGFVRIPAGIFQMGSNPNTGQVSEQPAHALRVSSFCIETVEVTQTRWEEIHDWAIARGYEFDHPGDGKGPNHPIQRINWYDAVKWCNARSERDGLVPVYHTGSPLDSNRVYRTGRVDLMNEWVRWEADGYRLPTEAEWEKAARGGITGGRFPGPDPVDYIDHERANYNALPDAAWWKNPYDRSTTRGFHPRFRSGDKPFTSPVGSFSPNGYGLYDMAGNVFEWCWDWADGGYHYLLAQKVIPANDAWPDDWRGRSLAEVPFDMRRSARGGGWNYYPWYCRVACRFQCGPGSAYDHLGLRCVRSR